MPLVSVILTSFNHSRFVRESIESVLLQTFKNFELIIWDDASTDNSWEIIQSYDDSRIISIQNSENKGPVFGVNKAIFEIAQGKYIAIHHSDDAWELSKLQNQVDILENSPDIGAVFTCARIIDEKGNDQNKKWFNHPHKNRWQWLNQLFSGENNLNHPSVLIRKSCYDDLGGYKEALLQTPDANFWVRLLLKYNIHVLSDVLTLHRHMHDKSNTSANTLDNQIRTENEWNAIRMEVFSNSSCEDVFNIFPELIKYKRSHGCNVRFLLAQACLTDMTRPRSAKALGISILYELLLDTTSASQLLDLYDFNWQDLASISALTDAYSIKCHADLEAMTKNEVEHNVQIIKYKDKIINLNKQAEDLNKHAEDLNEQILFFSTKLSVRDEEIASLLSSTSWKITKPFRYASHKLTLVYNKIRQVKTSFLSKSSFFLRQGFSIVNRFVGKVEPNFDRDIYLRLNPDISAAGIDPTTHYLLHGQREGRASSLPSIVYLGEQNLHPDRKTLLLVSHEASRTGAPILSLNLAQAMLNRYNVVALFLGEGALSETFLQLGTVVVVLPNMRGNPILATLLVDQLCERYHFEYALINSIESRIVLPSLAHHFIPALSLIHEFASYTRPNDAFRNVFFWSSEVIFSARITLDNALTNFPELRERSTHVLPQGRCLTSIDVRCEDLFEEERKRIRRLIRPKGTPENTVVILGAGFVQLRKGVDLFLDVATRVLASPDGRQCRFIWIGKGYDPENDIGYSVYLADQIRRAGLEQHIVFIDETPAIESAYEEADLFLLSSRLDPLPNVAIDAMAFGVPVLCFDKTTGIVDFLNQSGLAKFCVAGYLDSTEIAEKILVLAGSKSLRENIGMQCRSSSLSYFNMEEYVNHLDLLAQKAMSQSVQELNDTETILHSGLFRQDFSDISHVKSQSLEQVVCTYVRAWASGIDCRKPFPGFHPGIYLEQHGVTKVNADPLADYLRSGQPEGPWINQVILTKDIRQNSILPDNNRVALHLHVYYPELLSEITSRLSQNKICPDLFISIAHEDAREQVSNELRNYRGKVVDIQLVPNIGRDIGPLLTMFGDQLLNGYDFFGHIHTKKSIAVKDAGMGQSWRYFLLENLLGGKSGAMADNILSEMNADASLGLVFPDDPYIVGWSENRDIADSLASQLNIKPLRENFVFPVGSMFWAKTSALAPLINLQLGWDDYPEEPLPYDGTMLHAIERLLALIISTSKLRYATTNIMDLSR